MTQHGRMAALAVVQAVDEVHIPRAGGAGADGELPTHLGLGTGLALACFRRGGLRLRGGAAGPFQRLASQCSPRTLGIKQYSPPRVLTSRGTLCRRLRTGRCGIVKVPLPSLAPAITGGGAHTPPGVSPQGATFLLAPKDVLHQRFHVRVLGPRGVAGVRRWLLGTQHRAKLEHAPEGGVVALPGEDVGDTGPVLRHQLGAAGPVVLGDLPQDFLRAGRGADELVNGVAQLEGALGDPGDGPGQVGLVRPMPGGSDHVEHLFLGAVDDDFGLESSHDRSPFEHRDASGQLRLARRERNAKTVPRVDPG